MLLVTRSVRAFKGFTIFEEFRIIIKHVAYRLFILLIESVNQINIDANAGINVHNYQLFFLVNIYHGEPIWNEKDC